MVSLFAETGSIIFGRKPWTIHNIDACACVYCCVLLCCSLTLRVWELKEGRKIVPTDCNLGQLKRIVNCVQFSDDDQYMYCGTSSGDVLQVNIHVHQFTTPLNTITPSRIGEYQYAVVPALWSSAEQVQPGHHGAAATVLRQPTAGDWGGKGRRGHRRPPLQEGAGGQGARSCVFCRPHRQQWQPGQSHCLHTACCCCCLHVHDCMFIVISFAVFFFSSTLARRPPKCTALSSATSVPL